MSQNPSPENRPQQHNVPPQQPPQYAQPSGTAFEPAYPHQQGGSYAYGNGSAQVPGPEQNKQKRGKNVMGIIAFVVAVVGFIFACVPGALIVGWILLPIAFLLSIISFFLKGKKGFSIAALIISVVGTIVGILVFFFVVAASFDEAFSDDVSADAPAQEADSAVVEDGEDSAEEADDAAEEGTRENPYAIGTKIRSDEWDMTITGVTLDATDEVLAENEFNEDPESGNQYMVVDVELTYKGDEPGGAMPMSTVEYVSAGGNTFDGLDDMVVAPNELDQLENLYNGASTSGSVAIQIPTEDAESGVLAVSPDMLADKVFVAVK